MAIKTLSKVVAGVLVLCLLVSSCFFDADTVGAKGKTSVRQKRITMSVGQVKKITIKNKNAKRKYRYQSQNRKIVTTTSRGNVRAKKAGFTTGRGRIGKLMYFS